MVTITYGLVTATSALEVERATGLKAIDTPRGVLVEKPRPFNLDDAMDQLNRALQPNTIRCICGRMAILHSPNCPAALAIT